MVNNTFNNPKLEELLDSHSCERVIGTYLYPHVAFGEIDHDNPYQGTEIVKRINVLSKEVLISRNGGLFVEPPPEFAEITEVEAGKEDFRKKVNFEQEVAKAFDKIICELALKTHVVSEPVTPAYIARGQLKDNHALISGAGGSQVPQDRVLRPSQDLLSVIPPWSVGDQRSQVEVLDEIDKLGITSQLGEISEYLPTIISNAYAGAPKRQLVRVVVNSWLATTQILGAIWADFLEKIESEVREGILKNARAPTKTEMLYESGIISLEFCEELHSARQNRNYIMHHKEEKINPDMIRVNIITLRDTINFHCDYEVNIPSVGSSINW